MSKPEPEPPAKIDLSISKKYGEIMGEDLKQSATSRSNLSARAERKRERTQRRQRNQEPEPEQGSPAMFLLTPGQNLERIFSNFYFFYIFF